MKKTLNEWFKDYLEYRLSHGFSVVNANNIVKSFVNVMHKRYPDECYLTQDMIDEWGAKRDTEREITHTSRVLPVNDFIRHMNLRGENYRLIECNNYVKSQPPTLITEEQFRNVLRAADEMTVCDSHKDKYLASLLLALEMPILLRLMYSSGLRPTEIRLLDCENVDLENGLIYVRAGKGYGEHLVALDWHVNDMLKDYDSKISELLPNRRAFFPNDKGEHRSSYSLATCWKKLYKKYNNDTHPVDGKQGLVIYTLRHLYITTNIEQLPQNGWQKDIRLLAISRSAGHKNINTTIKYYYHLTARSGDLLDEKMGETFDNIIPDID